MNAIAITPETLPAITWLNKPVITTELLADVYGAQEKQIRQNFTNNASRFMEGIHYFKLVGEELKAFILQVDKIDLQISNMTRSLMLWTERGTVRHAKILDTDNAWLVQDKLEEYYFAKPQLLSNPEQLPPPKTKKALPGCLTEETQDEVKQLILSRAATLPKEKQASAIISLWSALGTHFGIKKQPGDKIPAYKHIPEGQRLECLSLIARLSVDNLVTLTNEEFNERVKALEGEVLLKEPPLIPTPTPLFYGDIRLLVTLRQGQVSDTQVVDKDHYVLDLPGYIELANRAGYIVMKETEVVNKLRG